MDDPREITCAREALSDELLRIAKQHGPEEAWLALQRGVLRILVRKAIGDALRRIGTDGPSAFAPEGRN